MREEHSSITPITQRLRELSPEELRQVAGGWNNGHHEDHGDHGRKRRRHRRWSTDD
ncbi:MAG TPA: hypothetical protein VKY90_15410 [Candidatus Dormibacteraeota bacterium]|nr:hypothetical protein [Candidatus Dormibacteraeota bacterium]